MQKSYNCHLTFISKLKFGKQMSASGSQFIFLEFRKGAKNLKTYFQNLIHGGLFSKKKISILSSANFLSWGRDGLYGSPLSQSVSEV